MSAPVIHKHQNYKLWTSGAYGNRLQSWRTVEAYIRSGFRKPVVIRYLGRSGGGWCRYNVKHEAVSTIISQLVDNGAELSRIMINEAAPDQHVVLNGELWTGADRLDALLYSRVRAHMRPALVAEQRQARGLETRLLLRSLMTSSSYEDLQVLTEKYIDHAIELTVFSVCVGDIPGRNALVWEIRRY